MLIQRIVKMTFKAEHCKDFEEYFETIKDRVGKQPGCRGVKLLKDISRNGVYFTYSVWDSQEDLDRYRHTELFGQVWPKVKAWFGARAEAWSACVQAESKEL